MCPAQVQKGTAATTIEVDTENNSSKIDYVHCILIQDGGGGEELVNMCEKDPDHL